MSNLKPLILAIILVWFGGISAQNDNQGLNEYDTTGKTQLIIAVLDNDLDKSRELIRKGADVNLAEKDGLQGTPLMYASSLGNTVIINLLLKNGAIPNKVDINNDHALNWATFSGKIPAMKMLLDQGADVHLSSKHGSAIDVALRLWHHDSVANVFRGTAIAEVKDKNQQQLIDAVRKGDVVRTKKLLNQGISPDTRDELGSPLLNIAAKSGHLEIIKILVDGGANPNAINRVGQTSLTWAARFNYLDVVQYLLDKGADASKSGPKYRLSPLIGAAVGGNAEIGQRLISHGAPINQTDKINSAAPIHWAIFYDHTEFVHMLLNHEADPYLVASDNEEYSAYKLLKRFGKEKAVNLIETNRMKQLRENIKGSWKVRAIEYQYPDTTYVMDKEPFGRFLFSEENYSVTYHPMMERRIPFEKLSMPQNDEILKAFKSVVFNTGTYKIQDSIIKTTADMAKVPGFEGGEQFYKIDLSVGDLVLTMYDENYPNGDKPEWYGKLQIRFRLEKEN